MIKILLLSLLVSTNVSATGTFDVDDSTRTPASAPEKPVALPTPVTEITGTFK